MARPIDPKLHAIWADRLHRQPKSGLSITRFCSSEGISPVSFHAWKRRLRIGDSVHQRHAAAAPAPFLPLALRDHPTASGRSARVEVELPGGVLVRVHAADPDFACRIVESVAIAGLAGSGGPC